MSCFLFLAVVVVGLWGLATLAGPDRCDYCGQSFPEDEDEKHPRCRHCNAPRP